MTHWLIQFAIGIGIFAGCVLLARFVIRPVAARYPLTVAVVYTGIFTGWVVWFILHGDWLWMAGYTVLAGLFAKDIVRLLLQRHAGRNTT